MAFKIGDPHDADSYNDYLDANPTNTYTESLTGKFLEFDDKWIEGIAFHTQSVARTNPYNFLWSGTIPGLADKFSLLILEDELQVFGWVWGDALPYQNDSGYTVSGGANSPKGVLLPASPTISYRYRIRLNDEVGQRISSSHTITQFQSQNNMVAGEQIRLWDESFTALLAKGTAELTYALGLTGRLGSEK